MSTINLLNWYTTGIISSWYKRMSVVHEAQRSKIQVDQKKNWKKSMAYNSISPRTLPCNDHLETQSILRKVESTDYVSDTDVYLVCLRIRRRCLRQITVIFPLFPNFLAISTFREATRRKTCARVTVNFMRQRKQINEFNGRQGKLPSARPRYLLFAQKNSGYLPWNPSDWKITRGICIFSLSPPLVKIGLSLYKKKISFFI